MIINRKSVFFNRLSNRDPLCEIDLYKNLVRNTKKMNTLKRRWSRSGSVHIYLLLDVGFFHFLPLPPILGYLNLNSWGMKYFQNFQSKIIVNIERTIPHRGLLLFVFFSLFNCVNRLHLHRSPLMNNYEIYIQSFFYQK